MVDKLFAYIESKRKYAIELISKLIAIPTINPPGSNYERMVKFLEIQCLALGLKTKKIETPQKILEQHGITSGSRRINLIAELDVKAKKTLHINFHYDVVPATGRWDTDPFRPVVKGNRIYGRGAEDMKGNIASIFLAIDAIKSCSIIPQINLQLSFTPDEEIGGHTGLGYLVQRGLVRADYAMGEGYAGSNVSVGNKGVLWAEILVKGKASHASMPYRGVNAFEKAVELAVELKKLIRGISKRKTVYSTIDELSKSPSMVIGGILEGGVKINIVPDMVRFSIDRRLIPEEKVDSARKELTAVVDRFNNANKDSKAYLKFITKQNPSISRKDEVFFGVVSDAIRYVKGRHARFCILSGATDMRYFMNKGIPSLGYSVKGGESWHSDNEFVLIDSLVDTAKVYALIISRLY